MMSPEQYEMVIEGMRNPKNSWNRSDSYKISNETDSEFFLGENDLHLAEILAEGGPVHAKYRRMMVVWLTINAPLYWWKEFDTYKVGTVANSCSTMHKIHSKEFTRADFSCEHLYTGKDEENENFTSINVLDKVIDILNFHRQNFLQCTDDKLKKEYWWQMIQLLPSSYNQKRTIVLNYEVLVGIYKWRRNHKLDEWHVFCDWIESLPYNELITGIKRENRETK